MKSLLGLLLFVWGIHAGHACGQLVFSEPFDETSGSVSGIDNTGGVSWNTACATCSVGVDWFEVRTNMLECEDTNGPATWTTGNIDLTPCSDNALITFTINAAGGLEECTAGCGCNCVDWVLVEYSLNGGAFASATSSAGGACAQGCTGGNYAVLGDAATFPFNFTYCIPATATSLVLRITLQTWANGERYRIDDVNVQCFSCVLPVALSRFTAEEKNNRVELEWETETPALYFIPERAGEDGIFTRQDSLSVYAYTDHDPLPGINYYRLRYADYTGKTAYSEIRSVWTQAGGNFFVTQQPEGLMVSGCRPHEIIIITDMAGRECYRFTATDEHYHITETWIPGFYMAYTVNKQTRKQCVFFVQ